jgi:hypothetical protein
MKTRGYKQKRTASRSLRQHIAAIASSPLGREIAMAAVVAVATAITSADKRQGLLKTIGRNLREAVVASMAPVIAEILRPARKQPVRRRQRHPARRAGA